MVPRHLCIGAALFGLLLGAGASALAQAQDNSASGGGVLLKPLGPAPQGLSDAGGRIVSQPPPAWSSGGTLSQPSASSAPAGGTIISNPIISTPTGVSSAPTPAPFT